MKKKLMPCLFGLFALTMGIGSVKANCSYSEKAALNNEVANVKVKYEALEEEVMPEGYGCDGDVNCKFYRHYININILNLSENFYINVKNEVTKKNQKYYFSQVPEDGILKIEWDDVTQINTFTITIYSSDKTSCPNTKLKVMHVSTPRRNVYASNDICQEVPDYYLCREYVTFENDLTFNEFMTQVEAEVEKQKESAKKEEEGFFDKLLNFLKENKVAIIVGTTVIAVAVAGTVIIVRKKNDL